MRRRRLIKAAGGTALAGLIAGCMGDDEPAATDTEAPTDTPEPTETSEPTDTPAETDTPEPTETSEPTETDTGTGTDTDISGEVGDTGDNLEVTNHEIYQTNGEVGLQGTIQNTGDSPYGFVQAEVTLQDDQGDILYEFIDETETESTQQLDAGSEWQFDVVFEEAQMSEVTQYTINVDGYPVTDLGDIGGEIDNQDDNLEVLSSHLTRQESQTFVTGDIKNVGQDDIENIEVEVTLYENETNAIADFTQTVDQEEEVQQLAPGQIWEFRVVFDDVDLNSVARYVVTANSELV